MVGEGASVQQRDGEGLEKSGQDRAHVAGGEIVGWVEVARDPEINPGAASSGELMAGRNAGDSGKSRQFGDDFPEERDLAWIGIPSLSQSNVEVHGLFEVKAGIEVNEVHHAPDEQAGADEQSKTESSFSNYECVLQPIPAAARGRRCTAIAEGIGWIGARYAPCWE